MKLSTSSQELLAQLQTVTRVASTRSAVQALSGVQLAADGRRVELRATDMEVGAARSARGRGRARRARSSCPARLLLDVVRQLPAGDVVARAAARRAGRRGRRRHRDASTSARCAPRTSRRCPSPAATRSSTMPAQAFVETIARVARSASRDETRPILTGILVSAAGDELRMVATDSYRLSVKETRARGRARPTASRPTCRRARCEELERLVARRRRRRSASACAPTRSSSRSAGIVAVARA